MTHSLRSTAILDACVLYPAPVRDLLLHLASVELYKPKWTDRIHEEWKRSLLKKRPDLKEVQLEKTIREMNNAFPDATVEKYEALISSLQLPDADDCHVLAAAVCCKANVIVTSNLKDFPKGRLHEFDMEAQHPDLFISTLIDLSPVKSLAAFRQQVSFLRNPARTELQVLESLRKSGLIVTSTKLKELR